MNAMLGKIAVVIPPELEEKMKNNTELAQKVMERVDSFLLANSTPGENEGFLMTFDENGEINHACVVGELKFTVSSSEFVEARRAREAKHAEYERLAEDSPVLAQLPLFLFSSLSHFSVPCMYSHTHCCSCFQFLKLP